LFHQLSLLFHIQTPEPLAIPFARRYNPRFRAVRQGMPSRSAVDLGSGYDWGQMEKENEMPKLKTKSSAKKRFRLTASGKVRSGVAFKRHNLRKRTQKMKRKARGTVILSDQDARIVKSYMPYA